MIHERNTHVATTGWSFQPRLQLPLTPCSRLRAAPEVGQCQGFRAERGRQGGARYSPADEYQLIAPSALAGSTERGAMSDGVRWTLRILQRICEMRMAVEVHSTLEPMSA